MHQRLLNTENLKMKIATGRQKNDIWCTAMTK